MWVLIIVGFGGIALAGWYWSAAQRLKRQLRAAKPWPIGELPENTLGRVIGAAQPLDHVLHGPLTGRACVYYIAKVEQLRSTGRSSHWRTLVNESHGVPFVLSDPSGRAIVDPTGAKLALSFDGRSSSGTFDDANPIEEAFLAKHGLESRGWVFNKKIRYTEACIEVGETIAVLGAGVREPDPTAMPAEGYRAAPPTRLRLTSSHAYPLVISDDPSTTQA